MRTILFTVTNELNYDQRMQRICGTLQQAGYQVKLIGRADSKSAPLQQQLFKQKRLRCFFPTGPMFYAEYNVRLFFYLLFQKADALCAIDLDTILPILFVSKLRRIQRIYDAHELFTEMKEIVTRPKVHRIWCAIERYTLPKFTNGYTVNQTIANIFQEKYGVRYAVIRNLPFLQIPNESPSADNRSVPVFLYQGAVNEGRGFESLIPAMQLVDAELHIYGNGNFFQQTKDLIHQYRLEHKVKLMGVVSPTELKRITPFAFAGIMIVENQGLSLYYSLANKFFDFMMAGIPQICIDFPEYHRLNEQYQFAYMVPDLQIQTLADAMTQLMKNNELYTTLKNNCEVARKNLNWEREAAILGSFYKKLFEE